MALDNSLLVRLGVDVSQLQSQLASATSSFNSFGSSIKGSLASLGIGLSAAGVVAFAKSALDAADRLDEMSQQVGVSVQNLTALRYAFSFSGLSAEDMDKALIKLNGKISDAASGSKEAAVLFNALGVSVKNTSGQLIGTDEALGKIADSFANARDDASKTAIAVELFGKQGANLIPTLNLGAEGIEKLKEEAAALGVVLGTDTTSAAAKFNDEMDKLSASVNAAKISLVGEFLPFLQKTIEEFNAARAAAGSLGGAFGLLLSQSQETLDAPAAKIAKLRGEIEKLRAEDAKYAAQLGLTTDEYKSSSAERVTAIQQEITFLKELERNRALANKASYSNEGRQALQSLQGDLDAARKAQEAETEAKKAASEAAKKWATDYATAQKTVMELLSQSSGVAKDYVEKLQQLELWYGKNKTRTDEYVRAVQELIYQQPFYKAQVDEIVKAEEKRLKLMEDQGNAWTKSLTSAVEMVQSLEQEAAALKMTNVEREIAIKLRELERLGIQKGTATYEQFAAAIRDAVVNKDAIQKNIDANKTIAEGWKETASQIEQALTDALVRGFEGGKGIVQSIGQYILNAFKTWIAKGIAQALMGAMGAGLSGVASATGIGGGAAGGIGSLLGGGESGGGLGSLLGLGSAGAGMGSFMLTGLMNTIAGTGVGTGLGAAGSLLAGGNIAGGIGMGLGAVAPYALAAYAAYRIISGKGTGRDRAPAIGYQGLGQIGAGGTELLPFDMSYMGNPGGGSQTSDIAQAYVTMAGEMIRSAASQFGGSASGVRLGARYAVSEDMSESAGLQLWGPNSNLDINASGTLQGIEGIQRWFEEKLPVVILAGLQNSDLDSQFKDYFSAIDVSTATKDQVDAAIQAASAAMTLTTALEGLGANLSVLPDMAVEARLELANLFGGVEGAIAAVAGAYDVLLSDGQKLERLQTNLTEAFNGLNLAMPTTRDALLGMIEAQDLTTESGRATYAALVKLAVPFDSLLDQLEALAPAATDVSTAIQAVTFDMAEWLESIAGKEDSAFRMFMTDAQLFDRNLTDLLDTFTELGLELPDTEQGFLDLLASVDKTTDSGRSLYEALLDAAPAFDEYIEAIKATGTAVSTVSDVVVQAAQGVIDWVSNRPAGAYTDEEWERSQRGIRMMSRARNMLDYSLAIVGSDAAAAEIRKGGQDVGEFLLRGISDGLGFLAAESGAWSGGYLGRGLTAGGIADELGRNAYFSEVLGSSAVGRLERFTGRDLPDAQTPSQLATLGAEVRSWAQTTSTPQPNALLTVSGGGGDGGI